MEVERRIFSLPKGKEKNVLDINTSEKKRDKAYRFMSIFISCISKIGGRVYVDSMENNDNTMITLLGSKYKCSLYEKQVKLRDKAKTEERNMRPLYDLEYTGELYFKILGENKDINKKDTWELLQTIEISNSGDIKGKLIELFYKLRDDVISKKIIIDQEMEKKQEEIKKEIKKLEEEKIREEQVRIEKENLIKKQKMQENINNHMDKWEHINKVLMYVNNLRSMIGASDNEKNLILKYCDYVEKIYSKSKFYEEILEFSQKLD
ncbi:hypothetical protein A500_17360 [Clostridium sartagoforme AAU1]|uniref:Uncharacterized protein n=1 Tax=Clostridium sartagoforme AAU1 TaxID=1202534 RepID=R9BTN2_9CLOT|nr:hypothetical protein [Clostridium sartagoforme]EOR20423.1 hypothetical protein A500_17360 [Clostridium sartagoforme AAU1]